jgi:phosphodiesterase/alkaline phosphatase D-like protein
LALVVRSDRVEVGSWDLSRGDRRSELRGGVDLSRGVAQVCVGGEAGSGVGFHGSVDEVRLWRTARAPDLTSAWRERRLDRRGDDSTGLLAYWPYSTGTGEQEPDAGPLGPLSSTRPEWLALPRLTYGPILRWVQARSGRILFGARRPGQFDDDQRWIADLEFWPLAEPLGARRRATPAVASAATDGVGHVVLDGLSPQTTYAYVPFVDGRQAIAGPPEVIPRFATPPDLGTRNADFTAVFLADQHAPDGPAATPLTAYAAALRDRALFWAQLGDVAPGSTDGRTVEWKRSPAQLRALWERNYGDWSLPQNRLARAVPLNLATINDHEIANNYSMNWHRRDYAEAANREEATSEDRRHQYDASWGRWWNYFGWGPDLTDPLGEVAREDRGQSVMEKPYRSHGLYHTYRPYPFVEFFVVDTTSYRGDPYQERLLYDRRANWDTDHARYPWSPGSGPYFIFGDRPHGADAVTDRVRSWLGPLQKAAFLASLRGSAARVLVIAAGYPLYSLKFETSTRYWEGRESGFDFAREAAEILDALSALDRLVLWVHGDGHAPALVKLRTNVYQLQVGSTFPVRDEVGHRPRSLTGGSRSLGDLIGGGELLSLHQPDLAPGDLSDDVFLGGLDQFEGYLRLYFHPGQEAWSSADRFRIRRGSSDREIAVATAAVHDPATGRAADAIIGRVARLRFGERSVHGVVSSYRFEAGTVRLQLAEPLVTTDPDDVRILIDAEPWVEARWFDASGREWRHVSGVLRREPVPRQAPDVSGPRP